MPCRATRPRTSALASSAMSQSARAGPPPKRRSSQSWSRRWPEPICPPLRPEAPQPTRCASSEHDVEARPPPGAAPPRARYSRRRSRRRRPRPSPASAGNGGSGAARRRVPARRILPRPVVGGQQVEPRHRDGAPRLSYRLANLESSHFPPTDGKQTKNMRAPARILAARAASAAAMTAAAGGGGGGRWAPQTGDLVRARVTTPRIGPASVRSVRRSAAGGPAPRG